MSRPQQKSVWYLQIFVFVMTEGRTRTYHQAVHTFVCRPKVIQIEAAMKICTENYEYFMLTNNPDYVNRIKKRKKKKLNKKHNI